MVAGYQGPEDRFSVYAGLVGRHPPTQLKGATMPYTSHNGHMFSFLDPAGMMALRLPADDRAAFVERFGTTIAEQHGRQMREFVVVPSELLERPDEIDEWFRRSEEWVGTLKPKPTKRA